MVEKPQAQGFFFLCKDGYPNHKLFDGPTPKHEPMDPFVEMVGEVANG